jgi:predicted dehydrogenase
MKHDENSTESTRPRGISRREFVSAAGVAALAARSVSGSAPRKGKYRVAVIGHTGRGNYGHGLDRVWLDVAGTEIVAVADADPRGRAEAVARLGRPKGFADYREMLDQMRPDLVSIGPRWLDQHRDMVVAAADRGVRGIYLEKPMCRTLIEADEMVAACQRSGTRLAVAHQLRYSQKLPVIQQLIDSGELGQIVEFRARGKEDHRGGGEDLWVLGCHALNLMSHLGGQPQWCFGRVLQEGRPIRRTDVRPGNEGIGPLAGDEVHAMYRLDGGATGFFDSVRECRGTPSRFGLTICGSKALLEVTDAGHLPSVWLLPDSSWSPGRTGSRWLPVTSAGVDRPEPLDNQRQHGGNVLAVKDLIEAIEDDRPPICNVHEVRTTVEMIAAVFESQRTGGPVTFPLETRRNPLTLLS